MVFEHGKKIVLGLSNRSGRRNHVEGRNNEGWGGVRVKSLLQLKIGRWLHSDAQEAKVEQTKELLEQLTNQALEVEESSDEEQDSDNDN